MYRAAEHTVHAVLARTLRNVTWYTDTDDKPRKRKALAQVYFF